MGFWNSGVAKNGDGARADVILGSSPWRQKVSGLGASANRTLRAGMLGFGSAGVFFFSALDRLKVGVWECGYKFFVGVTGVLVISGPEPPCIWLNAVLPLVNDVRVVFPYAIVGGTGLGRACEFGVL